MAQLPAQPLWTDAYIGDTTHLTTIEHGAYLLLLMAMWRSDGSLPDDDKILARYARLTPAQWARVSVVVKPFFRAENGKITQGRMTDELNLVKRNSRQQSDKARARWLKTKETGDATAMPEGCQSDAPTPTPIKKEAKASLKKPRRKPEVELPEGWVPNDRNIQDAMARGFSQTEIEHEADRFRNHHHSKQSRYRDWDAAWRTWCGNAVKFSAGRGMAGKAASGGYGQGSSIASIVARRRAEGAV
jgi:uncharacterized protein YdaU (DUF1376 family)